MPLLERRERVEIKRVTMAIPADALELLGKYAEYLNRDKAEVLGVAIKHMVHQDPEFCREHGIATAGRERAPRRATPHDHGDERSA